MPQVPGSFDRCGDPRHAGYIPKVQSTFGEGPPFLLVMTSSGRYDGGNRNKNKCPMTTATPSKSERIDVRASAPVKQLLQEAARVAHKNVSEFLLDAGITAANQTLADRTRFELGTQQWRAFQEALDRPVSAKPKLKKLLSEPGLPG